MHSLDNEPTIRRYLGGPLRNTVERARIALQYNPLSLFVIESNGQGIGYTGYIENESAGGMDILIVLDPAYHRMGYGRLVLEQMVNRWTTLFPDQKLTISTQVENHPARRLLERFGFALVSEYKDVLGYEYVVYAAT